MPNDTPIFENYELFLNENSKDISGPRGAMTLVSDDGMFRAYRDALTEGITDPGARAVIHEVMDRQRLDILTESSNVGASGMASGWTVLSFPILVDIYAEPIISELMNVYPVDKPIISIPRARIKASTRSFDGTSVEENYIPTPTKMVRSNVLEVAVAPNTSNNIFSAVGLSSDYQKMNRRFTLLTKVSVTETDGSAGTHTHEVSVNFRPDNRNQIAQTFTFNDSTGAEVEGRLNGNIDYEKGIFNFGCIFSGGDPTSSFECSFANLSLRFTPVATMNGRTKVSIEMEMNDLTIDVNEDFMLDLTEEQMQDFNTIYKIDLIRTLSEAVKRQVLLNKDYELSYFLKASENDIEANGAKQTFNMSNFVSDASMFRPDNTLDVLRNIIPRISTLVSTVRRNFNMYPSYLLAGLKTASMLRSMQDMATNIPNMRGELGFTGGASQFLKMKVLESVAMDENKIYVSTKAPQNALEKSSIVDIIFRPLYAIQEVTDGNTRHFIRSRTMIEISRTDGLGYIEVKNMENFLG